MLISSPYFTNIYDNLVHLFHNFPRLETSSGQSWSLYNYNLTIYLKPLTFISFLTQDSNSVFAL